MLSALRKRIEKWKFTRQFPVRWLTYKARLRLDVDEAFNRSGGEEIFDHDYIQNANDAVKQIEDWQIKLMSVSFAISGFLVVGFVTEDASISLFGVSLKQVGGLKEVLLALSATIGVLSLILTPSKETLIALLERLRERSVDKKLLPLANLAMRSSFHVKTYWPREFNRWIFPSAFTKLLSFVTGLLWLAVGLFLFLVSFGLTLYLAIQIYRHPTLGIWSTVILYYVGAVLLLSIVVTVKRAVPMPYRDQSELQGMSELQQTNPAAHLALLKKYFGG